MTTQLLNILTSFPIDACALNFLGDYENMFPGETKMFKIYFKWLDHVST